MPSGSTSTDFAPDERSANRGRHAARVFTNWRNSGQSKNPQHLNIQQFALASHLHYCVAEGQMLKIQRKANGDVVLTLSGRLDAESISELSAALAAEPSDRAVALDLRDLVLVDRDTVRFLRVRERDGVALRNCPPYIRQWIAREDENT